MYEKEILKRSRQYYNKYKTAWQLHGIEQEDIQQELGLVTFKILKKKTFDTVEQERNYLSSVWHKYTLRLFKYNCNKSLGTVELNFKGEKAQEDFEIYATNKKTPFNKSIKKVLGLLEPQEKELIIDRFCNRMSFKDLSNKYGYIKNGDKQEYCRYSLHNKIKAIKEKIKDCKKVIDIYC